MILLLAGSAFAATPPKERIVWWPIGKRPFGLYLSEPNGGNERPFLAGTGPNYNPSFSWDGRWIIFTSERFGSADVFRVHPDGSGLDRLTDSPAFDDQGALSPDGRRLAFVSTREGGTANIWLLDIASHRFRNLTKTKAGNFRPSWSPDGKWIAFSSDRSTSHRRYLRDMGPAWELMQTTAIYIVHPDGSGLRRITPLDGCAGSPRWSPDAQRLVFAEVVDMDALRHFRQMTQVVSENIYTGTRTVVSDGKNYVRSPAYVSNSEIGYGLNNPFDPRGSSLAYTSGGHGPAGAENPSWTPDGSLLVYDKEVPIESKWVDASPSRDPRYELIGGSAFMQGTISFTRPGEQFLFSPPNSRQLKLVHWNGAGSVVFDGAPDKRQIGNSVLSAGGRTLAFGIWSSQRPEEVGQIGVMDSDGSHFRIATHDLNHADFPSFSPDGTKIVFRLSRPDERAHTEQGLRIVTPSDGKVVKLTSGWDDFPAWSPQGDRIAFSGFGSGDFEIYTIRPDGTGLRQLTHTRGNDAHPVWSPDGRWIAFNSSRMGWKDESMLPWHGGGGQSYGEIFVMRADGRDVRQLTDDQWEEGVTGWAPP
jgi:TolB protein